MIYAGACISLKIKSLPGAKKPIPDSAFPAIRNPPKFFQNFGGFNSFLSHAVFTASRLFEASQIKFLNLNRAAVKRRITEAFRFHIESNISIGLGVRESEFMKCCI